MPVLSPTIPKCFVALLLIAALLVGGTESAFSLDAQHWQQLPDSAKRYYVLGSVEAWNEAIRFTSDAGEAGLDDILDTVMPCVTQEKRNADHVVDTVQKYINEHHSEWHLEMSIVVFTAVTQTCVERNGIHPRTK